MPNTDKKLNDAIGTWLRLSTAILTVKAQQREQISKVSYKNIQNDLYLFMCEMYVCNNLQTHQELTKPSNGQPPHVPTLTMVKDGSNLVHRA